MIRTHTYGELAALTREQFYALALSEAPNHEPRLAEFATKRLWDTGWIHERGAGQPAIHPDAS